MRHKHARNSRKGSVSLRPFGVSRRIGLTLLGLLATGAWAHGQSLPVSDPYDILATDPAAFIQLLDDARPSPVTPETKEKVLRSLPPEGEITVLNAAARGKLAALYPVLRATRRDVVYEVKIIDVPQAAVAIHGRAVILIPAPALGVLDADQLRAAVAHEAAHEYVWEEWHRAAHRNDWKRLRQLELICDGIATVILHQLGLDSSALITGFEKMIGLNHCLGDLSRRGVTQRSTNGASSPKGCGLDCGWILPPSGRTQQRPPPLPLSPCPVST